MVSQRTVCYPLKARLLCDKTHSSRISKVTKKNLPPNNAFSLRLAHFQLMQDNSENDIAVSAMPHL
jgi:hypothetical protein